ncbi:TPA: Uma2 family endonuclease [Candidatus Poribacteria bacterium]|nr:Uma2 family endonuclease [Candidatus Poribacteria bacterium]
MKAVGFSISDLIETKRVPQGKVTFEEFLDWCDEDTWAEWVDGEIVLMSPSSTRHQRISSFLEKVLGLYTELRGLGEILRAPFAMRLPFVRRGREPDLLFVAYSHAARLRDTYLDGPADLVIEIVSEESIDRDYEKKLVDYERGGVPEYWLIDPLEKEAFFYQRDDTGQYILVDLAPGGIYHSLAISDFWLKVNWLWQEPLPSPLRILAEITGAPASVTEAFEQAIAGENLSG